MTDDDASHRTATAKLLRAGVITHLAEIPPEAGRLEADALTALLTTVGHSVFRVAPFVYGLDLAGDPLAGDAAGDVAARAGDIAARLDDLLGPGVVRISPAAEAALPQAGMIDGRALQLIRVTAGSLRAAMEPESGELRAVLDAGYAIRAAELTAHAIAAIAIDVAEAEGLERRIDAMGAAIERLTFEVERLDARPSLAPLAERLAALEDRCAATGAAAGGGPANGKTADRVATDCGTADGMSEEGAGIAARLDALDTRIAALSETLAARDEAAPAGQGGEGPGRIAERLDALAAGIAAAPDGSAIERLERAVAGDRDRIEARLVELRQAVEALAARQEVEGAAGRQGDMILRHSLAELAARLDLTPPLPCAGEG